jgi:hypothetical protein
MPSKEHNANDHHDEQAKAKGNFSGYGQIPVSHV